MGVCGGGWVGGFVSGWVGRQSQQEVYRERRQFGCVCVRECMRVCARASVRACEPENTRHSCFSATDARRRNSDGGKLGPNTSICGRGLGRTSDVAPQKNRAPARRQNPPFSGPFTSIGQYHLLALTRHWPLGHGGRRGVDSSVEQDGHVPTLGRPTNSCQPLDTVAAACW